VALSVVGTGRLPESGYFRGQGGAGETDQRSHATQFFEFVGRIADDATVGNVVHLAPVLCQPIAGDDVAEALARVW